MAEQRNNPHRRRAAHARTPEPPPGPGAPAPPGSADHDWFYPATGQTSSSQLAGGGGAAWPPPGTDYPSWPADADQYGWVPGADHPSWPMSAVQPYHGADHPSWPAGGADWPQPGTDYSSWPADAARYGWSPDPGGTSGPQRDPAVVQHHEQRWQAPAPVQATRYEYPYPARPAGGAHAGGGRWSAQLARTQDTATQTYYELAFGDGRLQVMLTEPPATGQDWATGTHGRSVEVLPAAGTQTRPAAWEAADLRNTDAVRVAERILSDADQQATELHREASAQATAIREAAEQEAAEIRQQAAAQAVPVREAAEREAAEIKQQAAAQAAAIREAAEREAAELRAHLLALSAELGRVAAYVTENLTSPAVPLTKPAAPPARPAAAPSAKTAVKPAARPATKPAAEPAAKPAARPRQFYAMRRVSVGVAALVAFALTAGITEAALHGYQFFVFRQGGTGSTPGNVIKDSQFMSREHHEVNVHQPVKVPEKAKALHKAKADHGRHAGKPK